MKDLNSADHVYVLDQPTGQAVLFGNEESGRVGYVNTSEPGKSTYFEPHDKTVAQFVQDKIGTIDQALVREVPSQEIEAINKSQSVDHASNFHEGRQVADRSVQFNATMPDLSALGKDGLQDKSIDDDHLSVSK